MSEPMVQVPRRLIEELRLYAQAQPEPAFLIDERNGSWTRSMVEEFKAAIERQYTKAGKVFRATAEKSPDLLYYRTFILETGLDTDQVRAELGGASKTSRRLFGHVTWPMSARDTGDGMTYQMPMEVARLWLE